MSLFASPSASGSKNLVEFRAGKLFRDGNMVKPDNRKGLVYVYEVPLSSLPSFFSLFFFASPFGSLICMFSLG